MKILQMPINKAFAGFFNFNKKATITVFITLFDGMK